MACYNLSHGNTRRKQVSSVVNAISVQFKGFEHNKKLQNVEHQPCGLNRHQPSLIRGGGLWEGKTSLHDKGFYRPTVTTFTNAIKSGESVFIEKGAAGPFVQTWVFVKRSTRDFNDDDMKQLHAIFFAEIVEQCKTSFTTDGSSL